MTNVWEFIFIKIKHLYKLIKIIIITNRTKIKERKTMVKKIRVEKWELYYMLLCMVFFGFWMGYILGGSSSWAAKPEVRDEFILNGFAILGYLSIIFLLIKVSLDIYRRLNLKKMRKDLKEKSGMWITFYFFFFSLAFYFKNNKFSVSL